MLRVVLDPGVLVSALITPLGPPAQLFDRGLAGWFEIVVSPALHGELESVLERAKFRRYVEEAEVRVFLETLRRHAVVVDDPDDIDIRVTGDPGDDYLVALARSAAVHLIVSGDRHLTELESLEPPVVTPRDFLMRLDRLSPSG